MLLLALFALIAGAATAASPCALPILPVVLAAGSTGGKRRPAGLATGLVVSFTFATVALVYLLDALGLPDNALRVVAIVVLAGFGLVLVVPALATRVEGAISRLGLARAATLRGGDGFVGGFGIGLGLGAVYAPCAGPILAGVITVSAAQSFAVERLVVAAAYGIGAAIVLFALALGARRVTRGLRRSAGWLPQVMGALMVVVAVLMAFSVDTRFQTALANHLPRVLVDPAHALEDSDHAQDRLARLRGESAVETAAARRATEQSNRLLAAGKPLAKLRPAPAIEGGQEWFNTQPLTPADLRGHVVLVDFWTYSCINCVRTFPFLRSLYERYRSSGLIIVGVHTPEFPFERDAGNVRDAIAQNELRYPVVQDNDATIWKAFKATAWPTSVLIDPQGEIRRVHTGEGDYAQSEQAVRSLLAEAHTLRPGTQRTVDVPAASAGRLTPEVYFGARRGFTASGRAEAGTRRYDGTLPDGLRDLPALTGRWRTDESSATAVGDGAVELPFTARRVFMVAGGTGTVGVTVDGKPQPDVRVVRQGLLPVAEVAERGDHTLRLTVPDGVSLYTFTFG